MRTPARASRASVFGPTPHSARTGIGARNAASVPGGTKTRPSGFFKSEAIFATLLLLPMPTDSVSPVAFRTSSFSSLPMRSGSAPSRTQPLTSTNASSSESGSTSGDSARKIAMTRREMAA